MYEDIPHLLAPVVTDPAKAVRALKWAVEQMEERYRQMSSVGVRSLASFNDKVRAAKAKGQPLGRKVQIGYENGKPVYEEEQLEFETLPQIEDVFDIVFIDAEKEDYERLFQLARDKVEPGGLFVADNVLSHADPLAEYSKARQADPTLESVTLPLDRGLELSVVLSDLP
jgi:hypothetical protein